MTADQIKREMQRIAKDVEGARAWLVNGGPPSYDLSEASYALTNAAARVERLRKLAR